MSVVAASSVARPRLSFPESDGVKEGRDPSDNKTEITSTKDIAASHQEVKAKPKNLRNFLPGIFNKDKMRYFVIKKLKVTAADLVAIELSSTEQSSKTAATPLATLPTQQERRHECTGSCRCSLNSMHARYAETVSELDHDAEMEMIAAGLGSHNEPRQSQDRLSISTWRGPRHEFIGGRWSQHSSSDASLARLQQRNPNRDSAASYDSQLSSGERSDVPSPRPPQAPQLPHPTAAAGPGIVVHVANHGAQQEGSPRDSVMED
jgi:hypothetical protein